MPDPVLYIAEAVSTGDGRNGHVTSSDQRLDLDLALPPEMGGSGAGTNPEQLFAAGWSACFLSAIKHVAGQKKITIPDTAAVDAEIDLGLVEHNFTLGARLNVSIPGLDKQAARDLVDAAHQVCPYSRATRGNVDVTLNVV